MGIQSDQTVVIHHWHPDWKPEEIKRDCYPNSFEVADDAVISYVPECSVPLTVTVAEGFEGGFQVTAIPAKCPLCGRRFSPTDLKRIRNAVIETHLQTTSFLGEPTLKRLTDLVLDI